MQAMKLPQTTIDELERENISFFLGGEGKSKIHPVAWEKI